MSGPRDSIIPSQVGNGAIQRELLRDAMLASLRVRAPSQYVDFQRQVETVPSRGMPVQPTSFVNEQPYLRTVDERRFREIT
jgi:hypothetical protein